MWSVLRLLSSNSHNFKKVHFSRPFTSGRKKDDDYLAKYYESLVNSKDTQNTFSIEQAELNEDKKDNLEKEEGNEDTSEESMLQKKGIFDNWRIKNKYNFKPPRDEPIQINPKILAKQYKSRMFPRKPLSYSDIAMLPKEATPWPEDPPNGNHTSTQKEESDTWIYPRNNDGHGTVVYHLQNYHWRTRNAYDLNSLKELDIILRKLDTGEFPVCIIFRGNTEDEDSDRFCPGADLKAIYNRDIKYSQEFYKTAYEVCYTLATMKKPVFLCMHGETMGIGAGMSLQTLFRISTEDAGWAFPNTHYGAFPDCGATWFLPGLDGSIGMYLALTGKRLESYDIVRAGIATHLVTLDSMLMFERDTASYRGDQPLEELMRLFVPYPSPLYGTSSPFLEGLPQINKYFDKPTLVEIFDHLEKEKNPWAEKILNQLNQCSPLMLHVTFRLQKIGKFIKNLEEALNLEYRVALHMLESPDFYEGIRYHVINNTEKLKWKHKDVYSVSNEEIAKFFQPHPYEKNLKLRPCTPYIRPISDPYSIYIKEIEIRNEYPYTYFILKQLDKFIPPEQQSADNLVQLYKKIIQYLGIDKKAAEFWYKADLMEMRRKPNEKVIVGRQKRIDEDYNFDENELTVAPPFREPQKDLFIEKRKDKG